MDIAREKLTSATASTVRTSKFLFILGTILIFTTMSVSIPLYESNILQIAPQACLGKKFSSNTQTEACVVRLPLTPLLVLGEGKALPHSTARFVRTTEVKELASTDGGEADVRSAGAAKFATMVESTAFARSAVAAPSARIEKFAAFARSAVAAGSARTDGGGAIARSAGICTAQRRKSSYHRQL